MTVAVGDRGKMVTALGSGVKDAAGNHRKLLEEVIAVLSSEG